MASESALSMPVSTYNDVDPYFCRLLTLWFEHGEEGRVYDSLIKGLKLINIENWLQVIPQLIARIDTNKQRVGKLIHTLLCDISKHHPQVGVMMIEHERSSVTALFVLYNISYSICLLLIIVEVKFSL